MLQHPWMRFFASVASFLFAATGAIAAEWQLVGHDPFSPDIEIYLDMESLELVEADTYYAVTLTVHPVEQWGIEREDGTLDRRYPHRSVMQVKIYDCSRTMDALGQSVYFSGTRPSRDQQVHRVIEDDTLLYPPFLHDPIYSKIC